MESKGCTVEDHVLQQVSAHFVFCHFEQDDHIPLEKTELGFEAGGSVPPFYYFLFFCRSKE